MLEKIRVAELKREGPFIFKSVQLLASAVSSVFPRLDERANGSRKELEQNQMFAVTKLALIALKT